MKILLLALPVILLGCASIETVFQDDIDLIEACGDTAIEASQNTFEGCTLLGGEPEACLTAAKNTAQTTFEECLNKENTL